MQELDDLTLKAEIDEIVKKIDSILQKVESLDPARKERNDLQQD